MILIVMGVSGAGKTTVGKALADKLSYEFYDADDFHPHVNKQKMAAGIALTDEDRLPWLNVLNRMIKRWSDSKENSILACSALKKSYRLQLISGVVHNENICDKEALISQTCRSGELAFCKKPVIYVYLSGTRDFINDRISKRVGHFMPVALLQSQFQDLEEPCLPENFISIDIRKSVNELVDEIREKIFRMDHC